MVKISIFRPIMKKIINEVYLLLINLKYFYNILKDIIIDYILLYFISLYIILLYIIDILYINIYYILF